MKKEIGGYLELDEYHMPMLHDGAIALNSARNALAYLIRTRRIQKLWIPRFICDSITGICEREGIDYKLYGINREFLPSEQIPLGDKEWLYFVNYYSQVSNDQIQEYVKRYKRIIVDNVQSYFQPPIPGVDTIYTCRKYFGVPDGAFLYTDAVLQESFPLDESFQRMKFILGRFERTASEFYNWYIENEGMFTSEPIKRMSKLTNNLLHAIDYRMVEKRRMENYSYLHERVGEFNQLRLCGGTFMYPLLIENGGEVRKELQKKRIYIPILWPTVFELASSTDKEYQMANNILPLPIDQRYTVEDMDYIIKEVKKAIIKTGSDLNG